ncbi:hypothetical protein SAMN06265222_109120 [Neorhodopirellula lusitana]|uniref:Serine protease n=2 Tax=Neorhodopirellula lusitana TaxID=445327 RepID=A0ABY1QAJ6_9BACT|nr:hypothetical protein SAMN06265222_109120 [Neorhodopirellula lusitana]
MTDAWNQNAEQPPKRVSSRSLTGVSHEFLTPRGLWLQQNSRIDMADGIALPSTIPGENFIPSDQPLLGRIDDQPLDPGTLQNLRPARRYPNSAKLRTGPLTPLFVAALADGPIWKTPQAWPAGYEPTQSERTIPADLASVAPAIGKLAIRLPGKQAGQTASGSAFITGPNTIMTCAHNLFDSNERQWSQGLEFHPGYDFYSPHQRPTCQIVSGMIPKAYLDNPLTNNDVAICRVDCNIGDIMGAELPIQEIDNVGFYDDRWVDILGYPAGSGFDFGKQLWRSRGRFLFGVSGGGEDDYSPVVATHFGGGASGCPWVYYDPDKKQHVAVGLTSGHARLRYNPSEPNLMTLSSSLWTSRTLERLNNESVEHRFV